MEIKEAQKKKEELEDAIATMLNDFINKTGLTITEIEFNTVLRARNESPHIAGVLIEVQL